MAEPEKQRQSGQTILMVVGAFLVFGAYQAVMVTADEYDPQSVVWMELGFDALMTVLAPVLILQVASKAQPSGAKTLAIVLGVAGFVAGLVQLVARFSSEHGWWTGHFNYAL